MKEDRNKVNRELCQEDDHHEDRPFLHRFHATGAVVS